MATTNYTFIYAVTARTSKSHGTSTIPLCEMINTTQPEGITIGSITPGRTPSTVHFQIDRPEPIIMARIDNNVLTTNCDNFIILRPASAVTTLKDVMFPTREMYPHIMVIPTNTRMELKLGDVIHVCPTLQFLTPESGTKKITHTLFFMPCMMDAILGRFIANLYNSCQMWWGYIPTFPYPLALGEQVKQDDRMYAAYSERYDQCFTKFAKILKVKLPVLVAGPGIIEPAAKKPRVEDAK